MSDTGGFVVPKVGAEKRTFEQAGLVLRAVKDVEPDAEALAQRVAPKLGISDPAARVAVTGDPNAARGVDQNHAQLLATHPGLARWYADARNAAIAHDDLPGMARTEDAITKLREAGFFGQMGQAGEKGLKQLDASMVYAFAAEGLMSPEDAAASIVGINRRLAELEIAKPDYARLQQQETAAAGAETNRAAKALSDAVSDVGNYSSPSDVLGSAGKAVDAVGGVRDAVARQVAAFVARPRGAAYSVVEQAANALPAIAGGALGATQGPAGFAFGTFSGEAVTEYGSWINEAVANRFAGNPDAMLDPAAVAGLLRDPEFMASVKSQARRKAIGTAGIDALFSFYAGRGVAAAHGGASKLLAAAGETAMQMASESASEAGGQALATGKVDWGESVLEGVSSLGQSVAEVGIGALVHSGGRGAVRTVGKALQAAEDARSVRQAAESLAESPARSRVPERTRQALEIMAEGSAVDRILVPVEAWDKAAASRKVSPSQMLAEIVPGGDGAYHEARQTGQVSVPFAAFMQAASDDLTLLDALEPDLRVRAAGLTLREAKEALDKAAEDVQAAATQAAAEPAPEDVAADEARADELTAKLGLPADGDRMLFQSAQPGKGPKSGQLGGVYEVELTDGSRHAVAPAVMDAGEDEIFLADGTLADRSLVVRAFDKDGKVKWERPSGDALRATADAIEAVPAPGVVGKVGQFLTGSQPVAEAVRDTLGGEHRPLGDQGNRGGGPAPPAHLADEGQTIRTTGLPLVESIAAAAQRDPAGTAAALRELADIRDRQGPKRTDTAKIEKAIRAAGRPAIEARSVARILSAFVQTMQARFPEIKPATWDRLVLRFARGEAPKAVADGVLTQGPRGAYDRLTRTVHLFETANETTLTHEVAHWMVDVLGTLAQSEPAVAEFYAEITKAAGAEPGAFLTVAQHETIAEAFVGYVFRGESPSAGLRRVFGAMREVLLRVYEAVKAYIGVDKLSPELRDVFDRMLASDDEIAAAEYEVGANPLPDEALDAMPDATRQAVQQSTTAAGDESRAALARKVMAEQRGDKKAAREKALDVYREQARRELLDNPANIALYTLRDGKMPDGTPSPDHTKISRASVADSYGAQNRTTRALDRTGVLSASGGISLDAAARTFGFTDGDSFAIALTLVANPDKLVDHIAHQRLAQEQPELLGTPGVKREARKAVVSDTRSRALLTQLKALRALASEKNATAGTAAGKAARETQAARTETAAEKSANALATDLRRAAFDGIPSLDAIRGDAARILAPMRLRDIRPSVYLSAARRESNLAADRSRVGAFDQAAQAKYREILNHELYRMAVAALDEADGHRKYLTGLTTSGKQAVLGRAGWTYQDQINALLARFNLAIIPLTHVDRLKTLAEWVKENEAERAETGDDRAANLPPRLLRDAFRTHWREMTMAELADVRETAQRIYHLADTKDDLLAIKAERKLSDDAAVVSKQAGSTGTPHTRKHSGTLTPTEKRMAAIAEGYGELRKVASLARQMDGYKDGGPTWERLVLPLNTALTAETVRRGIDGKALLAIHQALSMLNTSAFTAKQNIAGLSLSREDVLGIAELWGSEQGRDRVLNNFPGDKAPTVAQVQAALDTLTPEEIAYLRKKWAFWESYWPEIVEQAKRLEGIAPQKIAHLPYRAAGVDLPGGYAHLSYSGSGSGRLTAQQEADILRRTSGARTQTRHGYEESRLAGVSSDLTVRLDIGVGFQHMADVIHDLTLRETLIDAQRLLRHTDVKAAIISRHGEATWNQFRTAYADIAVADSGVRSSWDRFVQRIRIGTTASVLQLSLRTGLVNLTGVTQSMRRVGTIYVARGLKRWLAGPDSVRDTMQWVYSISDFMRTRSTELNQIIAEDRARVGPKRAAWQEFRWLMIEKTQLAVDMPTWIGAYEKAIDEMGTEIDEKRAVELADQAVRDSQGSGQRIDLAAIQRGGPWQKLFTTFYFFDSTRLQQTVEAVGQFKGSERDPAAYAKLASDMALLYTVPAILTYALEQAIVGSKGDKDPDDWLKAIAASHAEFLTGTVPYLREVNGVFRGFRDYNGPPALRLIQHTYEVANAFADADVTEGAQSINAAAGEILGYPAAQINRTWDGMNAVRRGRVRGARAVTAPLFGPPRR